MVGTPGRKHVLSVRRMGRPSLREARPYQGPRERPVMNEVGAGLHSVTVPI